jgi:hypothetical protein
MKERANSLFSRWPSVVLEFESFLKAQGLSCTYRREPASMYADRTLRYADAAVGVEVSTENGWRIMFADITANPVTWYDFEVIRKLIQYPTDKKLQFIEKFKLIQDRWPEIVRLFSPLENAQTRKRLREIQEEHEIVR